MIKTVIKLQKDLKAVSGQVLVIYDDGSVYSADPEALDLFIKNDASHNQEAPIKVDTEAAYPEKVQMIRSLLLSGFNISETAILSASPKKLVRAQRSELVLDGKMRGPDNKTPIKHHWFKTAESLASAKERGKRLGSLRKGKGSATKWEI